jgi:CheY-like chemotaxis protein
MRLLCVEDNSNLRTTVDLMLAATGIQVDFAGNGEEAVEAWQITEYDAVLMDIEMPGMNGLAAVRAIRQMEDGFHLGYTPVLFLSGHDDEAHVELADEAGGDGFLAKPFTTQTLLTALDGLMRQREGSGLGGLLMAAQ